MAAKVLSGPQANQEREAIRQLRDRFIKCLDEAGAHILLNGPAPTSRHPGNANLCFTGFDAHELLASLQPRVAASIGSACTTGIPEPSHVLQAMGFTPEHSGSSIRFSFGRFTTRKEIDSTVSLVMDSLRSLSTTSRITSQLLA